ncbi:hypothetical protein GBAR_LOCUS21701 [Geodia barretti]|uniref:Uncharacterized protein n=1 Tax=Geodia barretti TaxID=519541 RepID=A0AA35T1G9_GEOBA|nr:hypothetical protein GBAR_LOCUS21701 [Geodia barretti]
MRIRVYYSSIDYISYPYAVLIIFQFYNPIANSVRHSPSFDAGLSPIATQHNVRRRKLVPHMAPEDYTRLPITKQLCLLCEDVIKTHVNFGILLKEIQKHIINDADDDELHHMHQLSVSGKMKDVVPFLNTLDRMRNGFQIFYMCLRKTQIVSPVHRIVADELRMIALDYRLSESCTTVRAGRFEQARHKQDPRHLGFQFGSDSDLEPIAESKPPLSLTGDVPKTSPQPLAYGKVGFGSKYFKTVRAGRFEQARREYNHDQEPKITEYACDSCISEIILSINFTILQQQIKMHGITDQILLGVLRGIERRPKRYRHRKNQIRHMLRRLEKIENGLQIFYCSLKETQDTCPKHAYLVDKLEWKSTKHGIRPKVESAFTGEPSFVYTGEHVYYCTPGISLRIPTAMCEKAVKFLSKMFVMTTPFLRGMRICLLSVICTRSQQVILCRL